MTSISQPLFQPQAGQTEAAEDEDMDMPDSTFLSQLQPPQSPFAFQIPGIRPNNIQDTQDSTMEDGEDTAAMSPSPVAISRRSLTPHPLFDAQMTPAMDLSGQPAGSMTSNLASPHQLAATSPVNETSAAQGDSHTPNPGSASMATADNTNMSDANAEDDEDDEEDYDDDDDEEDDDDGAHGGDSKASRMDGSLPGKEELDILDKTDQKSALDDAHWQQQTFFDIDDLEVKTGDSGSLTWVVEGLDHNSGEPKKTAVMRSPKFSLGGYEWRIKLLPHGNEETERISVYVENITLQSAIEETWSAGDLPLPLLNSTKVPKRAHVAAQVSIILYNTNEPRVHEFKADAHRFTRASPDRGWSRFTSVPWYELQNRQYLQRQPLLRNGKLTAKAYVRIVNDPTGCLWAHDEKAQPIDSVAMTGLLPLRSCDATSAVAAILLHFRPYRQLLYRVQAEGLADGDKDVHGSEVPVLQNMLLLLHNMRSRVASLPEFDPIAEIGDDVFHSFGHDNAPFHTAAEEHDGLDVVETLERILTILSQEMGSVSGGVALAEMRTQIMTMFGHGETVRPANRLKLPTAGQSDIQSLVNQRSSIFPSDLLTLELDRQIFDPKKRRWKQNCKQVTLNDTIQVNGTLYHFYAFVTHEGDLLSDLYRPYVRPSGPGGLWYSYSGASTSCQTRAQAVLKHQGSGAVIEHRPSHEKTPSRHEQQFGGPSTKSEELAYVAFYVREDIAKIAFDSSTDETWQVPKWLEDEVKSRSTFYTNQLDMLKVMESRAAVVPAGQDAPNALPPTQNGVAPREGIAQGPTNESTVAAAHRPVTRSMAATITTSKPVDDAATTQPPIDPKPIQVTLSYFSQPYYSGSLLHGEYHGHGSLITLSGDSYTGNFIHGCRHGQGSITYANGDTYAGAWEDDLHYGTGTYIENTTGNTYSGNFKEGKKFGEGVTQWKVSEEEKRLCRICFGERADVAFYSCGHVVACRECASRVADCPVCRRRVRDVIRLYYVD